MRVLALGLIAAGCVRGDAGGEGVASGAPGAQAGVAVQRGGHALWMRRRWLHEARTDEEIRELSGQLVARGISVIYPFLGPMGPEGRPGWRDGEVIRPYEDATAARFFAAMQREAPGVRVIPWSGGILGQNVHPEDPAWRARFVVAMQQVVRLGAAGVQLNVEPLPTGTAGFLELLAEVRAGVREVRPDAILSVAAYPPTTALHPYPDVHWELPFLAEVCRIADDVSVMAYDIRANEMSSDIKESRKIGSDGIEASMAGRRLQPLPVIEQRFHSIRYERRCWEPADSRRPHPRGAEPQERGMGPSPKIRS